MRRARTAVWRTAVVLCAALAGLAACTSGPSLSDLTGPTGTPRHDGRPNIVFVLTDDLATNLLPYMPHVQALMQAGTSFEKYFVVDSLCCPSRAAIFTGQYPHNNGVFTNLGPDGGYEAYNKYGNPQRSFAVPLQKAGYRTAMMGKYLNHYFPQDPPAKGWDEWDVTGNGYAEYNYTLNENGSQHSYGTDPQDYLTDVLATRAHDFIDSTVHDGKPFALEVATFAPHAPYTAAPADRGTYPGLKAPRSPAFDTKPTDEPHWLAIRAPLTESRVRIIDDEFRRRVAAVQAVDRLIGHLERQLATTHQLSNTYFVFSSDNGLHMGEYGLMPGKQTAYDTDIRVPLIVTGPGVPAGRRVNEMASSIDLAPTFLNIAGIPPAEHFDGVSLLDLLHGDPVPSNWQRAVLVEHHGPVQGEDDPDLQPPSAGYVPSYEAMRGAHFLYVEYDNGEREYYDLQHDPYELHNLAGSLSPRRLAELHAQLQALESCKGTDACQRAASPAKV